MKRNTMLKVSGPTWKSRRLLILFSLFFLSPTFVQGQRVEKNITKEIPISENTNIKIQGPQSVRITGNGAINTRQINDRYIVSGKASKPYVYVIHKQLQVETWEKQAIKQVVKVRLECINKSDAEKLLNALEIEMQENAAENVLVTCELNIAKFKVENGWFKADDNHVVLNNGKRYPIKYLELSTTLYVPRKNRLDFETSETDVVMNVHEGSLNLRMSGGSFTAESVGETKGELNSVGMRIGVLANGDFKTKDCEVDLNRVGDLVVASSISNFNIGNIEMLVVEKNVSDHFEIGTVGKMSVANSIFSNFKINELKESIDMTLRNGDIKVVSLNSDLNFVKIKNQHAKVDLGIQNLQSYQFNCQSIHPSKYKIPKGLKVVDESKDEKKYEFGHKPEQTKIELNCSQCEVNLEKFSS